MLPCIRLACCLLFALASVQAAVFDITVQPLAGEKPAAGRYTAYVPDGVAKVRAIIFHQHGCGGIQAVEMVFDQHWRALADKWDALLLGDDLDDNCGNWYNPTDGSKAMQERAFAYFASQSGHPEITTAPICLWGHSGGGDWTIEFVQRYPEKVIAVYARSGGHDPGAIANGVPILFSHGWPSSNDYNFDYSGVVAAGRGRGAPWAWMIDPGGSHDCSNGRYVAIPYFDACMALRLPAPPVNAEAVTLRAISFTDGWTGLSAKDQMGQAGWGGVSAASAGQSTDATRSWLPSQDVAQRWSQFVTSGNGGQNMGGVSDTSPPDEAPRAVAAAISGSDVSLSWLARADLQGGIRRFKIYRDTTEVFSLGNWFQGHGFGDEPQPAAPAMTWSDTGVSNGLHWYEVATVNGSDVVGPRSARIPVFIGSSSDTTAPTISITTPATSAVTTTTAPIALAGVAGDNTGIASVVWANDRGGSGTASGTTTWSIPAVSLKSGTNTIRVTAYDASNHATSASVTVVFSSSSSIPATITGQPTSASVNVGQTATFSITAVGTPTLTYQWMSAPAGSSAFVNASGAATGPSYTTPAATAGMNGTQYRCVVSNGSGSSTSAIALLLVLRQPDGLVGGSAGLNYSFYTFAGGIDGTVPVFSGLTPAKTGTVTDFDLSPRTQDGNFAFVFTGFVAVPSDGIYTFFTASDDGSKLFIGATQVTTNDGPHGMQEIGGDIALKAGLHAITVQFAQGAGGFGLEVRWQGPGLVKGLIPAGSLYQTLSGSVVAPSITGQPSSATVTAGQTASFAVTATGTGPLSYQWKRGTTAVGGNSATLSISNAQAADAGSYTVVVTNSAGNATSSAATLTVNAVAATPPTVATPASGPGAPVSGTTAALSALGGPAGSESTYIYTWSVVSAPGGGTATFSPNGTNAAKNATATFNRVGTWQVQAVITNPSNGTSTISGPVTITVSATFTSVVVSGPATVVAGATAQFTAQGRDQFAQALASQPSFTWSATGGTVTSAGLFTAATSAGAGQITATSGGKSGQAATAVTAAGGGGGAPPSSESTSGSSCGLGSGIAALAMLLTAGGWLRFVRRR